MPTRPGGWCQWCGRVDDLTDDEWYEAIRSFIENEGGLLPKLGDLPAWWDAIDPDARDPNLPNYLARDVLIWSYSNFAFTKRWAWDGLHQLLVTLEDRREPIPNALKDWACSVVSRQARGPFKPPERIRNPKFAPKDDRDMRIMRVYNKLREHGWSEKKVKEVIMIALDGQDIRPVFRKMQNFQPFKRNTIGRP